ncbi:MAG: class I SAM-dependent rRNA methyltransferase [Pirellulaceae bacterium]|nr:class I SAM-dependent rRNA methyltransferase [Pirellulaceae bacterium]
MDQEKLRQLPHQTPTNRAVVKLKKGTDRRLMRGHAWVFSNEIQDSQALKGLPPGTLIHLANHQGKFLATAYANPKTLIAARIVSRRPLAALDSHWFTERFEDALALRSAMFTGHDYRLIYGEADGVPGLVVDRYGDYLVAQVTTAGIENVKADIERAFNQVLRPRGIVWRGDDQFRELEGLPIVEPDVVGEVPEQVVIREGAVKFNVDLRGGQKTGWFFDQRDNRLRLHKYAPGQRVLDAFSYAGGWAIHALTAGAKSATCLDRSEKALASATANAALNNCQLETVCGDAFESMRAMIDQGRRFDIVVLDPPALIKRKKDYEAGLQAYYQLNRLAAQLLSSRGLLVSCSCSHHLPEAQLWDIVRHTAAHVEKNVRITEIGLQSSDHPCLPAMPEMTYLKAVYAWLS